MEATGQRESQITRRNAEEVKTNEEVPSPSENNHRVPDGISKAEAAMPQVEREFLKKVFATLLYRTSK